MFWKQCQWVDNRNAFVVFLAVIAVPVSLMALPALLGGHGCALQNNAVTNMRSLSTAIVTYEATYNSYPTSLAALGPPPLGQSFSSEAAGYIDPKLASGHYIDYRFRYWLKEPLSQGGLRAGYVIVADPIVEHPGQRHYFTSEDAVVRSEESRPATAKSPQSHEDGCVCW